ncbi:MAG: hypothetical protein RQ968_03730 [Thermoproteota archaeon]|jgi:hypothetical protein|nr:hypothetical protein [Thermoproteota archaeon]MDT7886461.1 hypothetical protein [Thermoproteota archaeon]
MQELKFLEEIFGFDKVYLTPKGTLVLVLSKNGKTVSKEIEDIHRFIENVDRVEPPLSSELMLNILYEKIIKIKEDMEKELDSS